MHMRCVISVGVVSSQLEHRQAQPARLSAESETWAKGVENVSEPLDTRADRLGFRAEMSGKGRSTLGFRVES